MEEEKKESVSSLDTGTAAPTADQYASATIEAIKQRDELKKLLDEANAANKILLDSGINATLPQESVPEEKVDAKALLKRMATEELSNREYIQCALEARKAIIDNGGEDPFVPRGEKIYPTSEDYEGAERVAAGLQEMLDQSDGSDEAFLALYQARVQDIPIAKRKYLEVLTWQLR